jgi:ABC-type transport system involved in multi-copper enzyme maturation permease subunit
MFAPFWWALLSLTRRSWYPLARRWSGKWLLFLLALVYIFSRDGVPAAFIADLLQPSILADYARAFVAVFLIQHFGLLLAIAPAVAAGAISDEKTRGTLQYLLTTALQPQEIILAKWLGLSIGIGELALPGLPLLCLFGGIAGLEVPDLAGVLASTLLLLSAACALTILVSVWCRKTTTAVLLVYALGGLAAAALWYLDWIGILLFAKAEELLEAAEKHVAVYERIPQKLSGDLNRGSSGS